ncbi:hypothetical protein ACQBAR_04160 [Propionibacteriaceae bacterium Y1685]|uniref:hypothetical protein n=1 Tax=Microlunatus sp. Y1700 TaxID=3418487 RepID=UPI003B7A23C8
MSIGYRHWHSALVYSCLGRDVVGTGEQDSPDLAAVVALLEPYVDEIVAVRHQAANDERPWPVPLPDALSDGLPRAQFAGALHGVRSRLGLLGPATVVTNRRTPPSAEDLRLLADRPPHWG